ncbi:MAG: carboxypeptidase regulatory-like domain-containing protein [Acidobacteria bacterium]|nr:carboxypeptidase regulatory-like domain-containing protein [Acidobacteriota bacterium]
MRDIRVPETAHGRFWPLATLSCAYLTLALWATAAEVRGRVSTDEGKPVPYVQVRLVRIVLPPTPPEIQTAISDSSGGFSIKDVYSGTWKLCGTVAGRQLVDPCTWMKPSAPLIISDRDSVVEANLAVEDGVLLRVRIDDPTKILPRLDRPREGFLLQPGIRSATGFFYPLRLASSDRRGYNFEVVLPRGTTVRLIFHLFNAKLQDQQGKSIAPDYSLSLQTERGRVIPMLRYSAVRPEGRP